MKNINTPSNQKSSEVSAVKNNEAANLASFEELYLKKDYKGAANFLLQNKQQLDSGIFHYNLGTVYTKLNDFPAARYHLEKAIKEGYINSSSLNNLAFIKSQLQVDDVSTSTSLPDQFINSAISLPQSSYLSLTLVLVLLGIALIKSKKLVKKFAIIVFTLIALSPVIFAYTYLGQINYAITFKEVPLFEGPSKIFTEKGKVRAGSKIILGEYKDGWFYVKFPISLAGWVSKDQIGLY